MNAINQLIDLKSALFEEFRSNYTGWYVFIFVDFCKFTALFIFAKIWVCWGPRKVDSEFKYSRFWILKIALYKSVRSEKSYDKPVVWLPKITSVSKVVLSQQLPLSYLSVLHILRSEIVQLESPLESVVWDFLPSPTGVGVGETCWFPYSHVS